MRIIEKGIYVGPIPFNRNWWKNAWTCPNHNCKCVITLTAWDKFLDRVHIRTRPTPAVHWNCPRCSYQIYAYPDGRVIIPNYSKDK